MRPGSRWVAIALVLHGWLRRLLPAGFRERSGSAMAEAFETAARDAPGLPALFGLLVREAADLVLAGRRIRRAGDRSERGNGRDGVMRAMVTDVRSALRLWARSPGFGLTVVLTLALGVGSATAVWTLADGVLFRPLPHERPEELVMVAGTSTDFPDARLPVSWPNFEDLRAAEGNGLTDLAAFTGAGSVTAMVDGTPEALRAVRVTPNALRLLGNDPLIGRTLGAPDEQAGADAVVVLSSALWRSRFGASPGVIGSALELNGVPHVIVGVMPARFAFPFAEQDLWLPLRADNALQDRDTNYLQLIGRLAPGWTRERTQASLAAAMARLVEAYPADNAGKGVTLVPRRDVVVGDARPMMRLLLGASALLLLLACANIANLMLARGLERGRELAVRSALGAGRTRLLVQLVTETLVLAAVGGLAGALVARGLVDALLAIAPPTLPRAAEIALDARALVFAALATVFSAVLFGLLPAWRAASRDAAPVLREGSRGTGAGRAHAGLRALVVVQLALALVLVSGGALLALSLHRLTSVDPGFDAQGVYVFRVAPPPARYEDASVQAFYDALLAEVRAVPGVESAGATWALPFSGDFASGRVTVEGRPLPPGSEPVIGIVPVRDDYFETLRVPLIAGRMLNDTDDADAPPVVLLNRTAAQQLWPGEVAVGKRFRRGRASEDDLPWITVVGVVEDAKRAGLGADVEPEMYWTHEQAGDWARDMNIVVRARADAAALAGPVRRAVANVDPLLPVTRAGLLVDRIAGSVAEPRFRTMLLAAFGALALLLAIVGTYGVMAFAVTRRRHEIGVRMALGADGARVRRDVLGEGLRLVAIAAVLGVAGAIAGSRLLQGLLYDVRPLDARVHALAVATLVIAALAACWVPALRASGVDPIRTLKD